MGISINKAMGITNFILLSLIAMDSNNYPYNDPCANGITNNSAISNYYIRWVCEKAQGNKLLLIGEQNHKLLDILLREENEITVINEDENVIERLSSLVKSPTANYGIPPNMNVLDIHTESIYGEDYSTILVSNVLEYSFHPEKIFKKIRGSLGSDGVFLLAVPYGLRHNEKPSNAHFGFWIAIDLVKYFDVCGIDLIDSQRNQKSPILCFICKHKKSDLNASEELLSILKKLEMELEEYFYKRKMSSGDSCSMDNKQIQEKVLLAPDQGTNPYPPNYMDIVEKNKLINDAENKILNLNNQINNLKRANDDLQNKIKSADVKASEATSKYASLKNENADLSSKIKETVLQLNKELKEEERILRSYDKLNKEYDRIYKKYENLADTVWGKLTLDYWRFLRNRPRD